MSHVNGFIVGQVVKMKLPGVKQHKNNLRYKKMFPSLSVFKLSRYDASNIKLIDHNIAPLKVCHRLPVSIYQISLLGYPNHCPFMIMFYTF